MTTELPKPADRMSEVLGEIVAYCREAGHDWSNLSEAEALLAAGVGAEPSAWMAEYIDPLGNDHVYVTSHHDLAVENDMHGDPKPLYLRPSAKPTAQVVTNKEVADAIKEIMEQAQVFASAWSLVGGRFDSGNALEDASDAKDELRRMVFSAMLALAAQPSSEFVSLEEARAALAAQPEQAKGGDAIGITDDDGAAWAHGSHGGKFPPRTRLYTHPAPASPVAQQAAQEPFQQRVQPWMLACFGEQIAGDTAERNHRFLEEALELVQACGCTASEAHQLVDYVYGRPVGEPDQEVGGVMVTLAALCLAQKLDMHSAGDRELSRIWTKVDAIRAKQAAKPKHSPLPQAVAQQPAQSGPFLVRDVAELLGVSVPDVCRALQRPGRPLHSTNMAIAPEDALEVAKILGRAQQPAQVPDEFVPQDWFETSEQKLAEESYCKGWNACRAAMLAAAPSTAANGGE